MGLALPDGAEGVNYVLVEGSTKAAFEEAVRAQANRGYVMEHFQRSGTSDSPIYTAVMCGVGRTGA